MSRTGWHDGLMITKSFLDRARHEGKTIEAMALTADINPKDPEGMRRFALWISLADYGVNFDIPEMVALRMDDYISSPADEYGSTRPADKQTALLVAFMEACTEREMDFAEVRIAAGLPDSKRFRRWISQVKEGVTPRIPEETRLAMSEWITENNISVPPDILVNREMAGVRDLVLATHKINEPEPTQTPLPKIKFSNLSGETKSKPHTSLQEMTLGSPDREPINEERPVFFTSKELNEPITSHDEGAEFQLSLGL
ncbi:hypothetical protein WSS15_29250 [Acetobacter pasteurianus]|nr:hypothetical protein WSS15_29250 [Acetobacter pasteurianus]